MLILASRSPRRQALLRAAGISFRVVAPASEEVTPGRARGSYAAMVKRAALRKAQSVLVLEMAQVLLEIAEAELSVPRRGKLREPDPVLGADTIVVCEGEVLGKPRDAGDARRMLRKLSGKWHRVYTGLALVASGQRLVDYERTEVAFRPLSKLDIDRYIGTGEPGDKAGAYAIQGEGAALVRAVRGCYTNVIGLPLPKLIEMLAEFQRRLPGS